MGLSLDYRSTNPVESSIGERILVRLEELSAGRSWLSSEPVFLVTDEDGHLVGSSKPSLWPDADDAAEAAKLNLPDGTIGDVIDVLCTLSADYEIDWELSHTYSDEPEGYIRSGTCDPSLLEAIRQLTQLGQFDSED